MSFNEIVDIGLELIKTHPIILAIPVVIIMIPIGLHLLVKFSRQRVKTEPKEKSIEKMKKLDSHDFTILDFLKYDYETYYEKHAAELILAKDDLTGKKFLFCTYFNHEIDWVQIPEEPISDNTLKKFKKKNAKFTNGEKLEYGKSGGKYKMIKEYGTVTTEKKKYIIPSPYYNEDIKAYKIMDAKVKPKKIKHYNKNIKIDEILDATYYDVYYIIDRP